MLFRMAVSYCFKKFKIISMLMLATCQNVLRIHRLVEFVKTPFVVYLYFPSIFGICLREPARNYQEQIIISKDGIEAFKDIFQLVT